MKKVLLFLFLAVFCASFSNGQNNISGPIVQYPVHFDVSLPIRDMKPAKKHFWERWKREHEYEVPNQFRPMPKGFTQDGALQRVYNNGSQAPATAPLIDFDGTNNAANSGRVTPPDPAGDVGPNHYVQLVNCMLQIFSKTGTSLYGPVMTSTLWNGFNGNWTGHNNGDGIVLYDDNADRWIITQFAIDCAGSPYTEYEMVAVSTTGDPTGSYYRYAFQFDYMPDYPKLGVWQDGYYMAVNRFNSNAGYPFIGVGACVLERSKMLTGDPTARMVYFKTETLGGSGSGSGSNCWAMMPSDCDGTLPSAGTPNYFAYIEGSAELRLWALHADWNTTTNSTFTYVTALPVAGYTEMGNGSVPEQGSLSLDALGDRLMFRNQYRNFGSYESFVTCHSVNTGSGVAGIRWYEYRKTGSTFSLYQQSTYAPGDGKSRWMGSIAMNANGDIGLAYSVSSSTMYPSIYFTGRKASDPLNQMTFAEGIIQTGTVSMTTYSRWGDYSALNVDPTDNSTFWTTQEYVGTYGGWCPWATKIASFKFSNQPVVATQDATGITLTAATLNGTVNPNGLSTSYHFEWGTTPSYGNNTTTQSAGSGTATQPESANISGLNSGTTYHFRISAVNSDGTSNGNDFTFVPGAASVTTTAASSITMTTATAGGNVTGDGGSSVTARGTCWSTAANPTIAGNHTTDGSGTGVFTSSLTGLTSNTTYHIRAYATNAYVTVYGSDLSFTTLCGIYSLPFSESFATTSIPGCWSQIDHQGNGEIWQFGTITGYSPNPNLTGNYAFLNSDAYGSGNSQNADLITPTLNMTVFTNVTLHFNHYFYAYTGSSGTVSYSIDNGSTWTTIQTFTTTTANPAAFSQVITALAGQSQVKIKWNYTGSYGWYWAIDDVSITGTAGGPYLTVTPPNQNVPATPAGSTSFTVSSNVAWTVVSDQPSWCTVTPSGTGNGTITANYTINTSVNSRVANITTTVSGLPPVVVTVTQAGATPTLTVTPPNQNVPATPAGSTSFTVTSNTSWTVGSDQPSWCTVTPSGTGNGTITANYAINTSVSSRIANITTTVTGIPVVVVTVTQAGATPTLTVTPPNQNVPATPAGSTSFTVTSNTSWTVGSDQPSWCTVTPSGTGNGTITANYTINTSVSSRIANITTTVTGIPVVVVTVTQAGATPTLTVTPPNQNVPATPAGSTSFTVTSNTSWTVGSDQPSWCTVTPSGTGNGTIIANYTINTSVTSRIANIITTVSGIPSVVVTVTQDGATPTLTVIPSNQDVPATPAGYTLFTVTSNSSWTAISDQTWCTVTPSGTGDGTITASYAENTDISSRIATITVMVSGIPSVVVTVTQAGAAPTLTVTPPNQDVPATPAGATSFTVTSNSSWTVLSDQTWCTVTSSGTGNGTITANYTVNPSVNSRVANITTTVSGIPSVVVTVTQAGAAPTLIVYPPTQDVTAPAGSTDFTVTSNSSWTVVSDQTWCTPTPSGTGNGTLVADYLENTSTAIRTANLTVTVSGISPVSVTVIQDGVVGIAGHQDETIRIIPNPATGLFRIVPGISGNIRQIDILDLTGRIILSRVCKNDDDYQFNLSNASQGCYFVKVKLNNDEILVRRLVISKE